MTRMSVPDPSPIPDFPPARRDSSGLIDLRAYAGAGPDRREEVAEEILGVGVLSPLASTLAPPPAAERGLRGLVLWNVALTLLAAGALALALAAFTAAPPAEPQRLQAPEETAPEATPPEPAPAIEAEAASAPAAPAAAEPAEPAPSPAASATPPRAPRQPTPRTTAPAAPPTTAAPAPAPALPEIPTRAHVLSTLRDADGAVAQCFAPYEHGVIQTTVVIDGPTGRVRHAQVTGGFAGTPAGSCVARTLREVRFSPFTRERLEVAFPYRI